MLSTPQGQICLELKIRRIYLTWAFLVAQMVKNLLAMQETQVDLWVIEDPLE